MDAWIEYIEVGGLFAWLAALAGAGGALVVLLALRSRYKRPSAVLAIELGVLAFALGGVGWFLNSKDADDARRFAQEKLGGAPQVGDRPRNTGQSEVAAEVSDLIEAEAAIAVKRPIQVAVRAGGGAIVLGLLLFLAAEPRTGQRTHRRT